MSGGTAKAPPKAQRIHQVSHALPKSQCRPLDGIVIWLFVSGTLRLDDDINVAVEDVQEIEHLVH